MQKQLLIPPKRTYHLVRIKNENSVQWLAAWGINKTGNWTEIHSKALPFKQRENAEVIGKMEFKKIAKDSNFIFSIVEVKL